MSTQPIAALIRIWAVVNVHRILRSFRHCTQEAGCVCDTSADRFVFPLYSDSRLRLLLEGLLRESRTTTSKLLKA